MSRQQAFLPAWGPLTSRSRHPHSPHPTPPIHYQVAGRPALSARERAVAIRSLIVATASQSANAALSKAQHDVETFRRAQSFRGNTAAA